MVESQRNTIDHGGLVLFALDVAEPRDRRLAGERQLGW